MGARLSSASRLIQTWQVCGRLFSNHRSIFPSLRCSFHISSRKYVFAENATSAVSHSQNSIAYSDDGSTYGNSKRAAVGTEEDDLAKRQGLKSNHGHKPLGVCSNSITTRYSSPSHPRSIEVDIPQIIEELKTRPPNITYDTLSATNSHLLNIALANFIPPVCYPPHFRARDLRLEETNEDNPTLLPLGHHLVYFPAQVTELLDDGTDTLQWPGQPFSRRLWAGGSIEYKSQMTDADRKRQRDSKDDVDFHKDSNHHDNEPLRLNDKRAVCVESITNVTSKGQFPNEMILVDIERLYGGRAMCRAIKNIEHKLANGETTVDAMKDSSIRNLASIIEKRTLVFLRPADKHHVSAVEKPLRRVTKIPPLSDPSFSTSLTPVPSLLFRFSALTHNAHLIHLDPHYTFHKEHYEKPLVHGPLTLVLMLSILRSRLKPGLRLKRLTYRNLTPLFVNEELTVNVKSARRKEGEGTSEEADDGLRHTVWIEKSASKTLAVKGTAEFEVDGI